jgi:hypothetical protein
MIIIAVLLIRNVQPELVWMPVLFFVTAWVVWVVSFFGLTHATNRLVTTLGQTLHGPPLWLVYLPGWGTFLSFWLDQKAKEARGRSGD